MERIKFRYVFKHVESNEIRFLYFIIQEIEEKNFDEKVISYMYNIGFEHISRDIFTGFNDTTGITGQEIYENDIVKIKHSIYNEITCQVIFERGCFYLKNIGPMNEIHNYLFKEVSKIEVIGNVYTFNK